MRDWIESACGAFAEAGRSAFREWLETTPEADPPYTLLDDPVANRPLTVIIPRPTGTFGSRYELGEELVDLLSPINDSGLRFDAGIWDWLSLLLISQLCPSDAAGRRKSGQIARYLLQLDNHRTRYRHLVRTASSLVHVTAPARASCCPVPSYQEKPPG